LFLLLAVTSFICEYHLTPALTNVASELTPLLAEMINQYAQMEQTMNAVERILHYTDLPGEAPAITTSDPPPSWPDKGEITFKNVEMRYRENLPLVLDDVTFHVRPGEKVSRSWSCF
jgi:ATP-binding cassette, subfamily C (CFTR/MRP), member 1